MKQFSSLLLKGLIALGALTTTLSAAPYQDRHGPTSGKMDAEIVAISATAGLVKFSNGHVLDRQTDRFALPDSADIGDVVRLVHASSDGKKRFVLR